MIKVGILGGAGYTAGELIRLLINHPQAEIKFVNSESNAGNLLTDVHEGLYGDTDMRFTSEMPFYDVDVVFFCFGHGKSEAFLKEHDVPAQVRIIDLAQDFRLGGSWLEDADKGLSDQTSTTNIQHPTPEHHNFVYGLPEINKERIAKARYVANPGCLPRAYSWGVPAAQMKLIDQM
jgi:N-acetyl-gamma-glutamyl-phosphate reductase